MAKNGRPKLDLDYKLLEGLCQVHCTFEEISSILKISIPTIQRRIKKELGITFEGYYKKNSAGGKMSLRRAQFKTALAGNPAMQIWLGKQMLGQKDQPAGEDEATTASPVSVNIQIQDASIKAPDADQSHRQ